jgi:hypothetical protein
MRDPLAKARSLTPPDGPIWPHPVTFTAKESLTVRNNLALVLTPSTRATPGQGAPRSIRQYALIDLGGSVPLVLVRP